MEQSRNDGGIFVVVPLNKIREFCEKFVEKVQQKVYFILIVSIKRRFLILHLNYLGPLVALVPALIALPVSNTAARTRDDTCYEKIVGLTSRRLAIIYEKSKKLQRSAVILLRDRGN